MNSLLCRSKIIVLLLLLTTAGAAEAISPQLKNAFINFYTAYECYTQVKALVHIKIYRSWLLKEVEAYSADEVAMLKRIVEPYVSADDMNNILSCIRKPKHLSQLVAPCSLCNLIVVNPRLLLPTTCNMTDIEFAYIVLHEYGHVINGHTNIRDMLNLCKALSINIPLIALQIYKPNMRHVLIQKITYKVYNESSILLQRRKEFVADDYAFNALKADAPVGCIALEKLYKSANYTITTRICDKPSVLSKAKILYFDRIHPTMWARYQHACRVAKKYGWKQEEQTIIAVGDIVK